jgi:hypothetical protein
VVASPLLGQSRKLPAGRTEMFSLNKVGVDFELGGAELNVTSLNNRLAELEIGKLEDVAGTYHGSFSLENYYGLGISFELAVGVFMNNVVFKPNTFLGLNTFSFGPSVYFPLVRTNRFRLLILGGIRSTELNFSYNANTMASPGFNALLNNPGANSNVFELYSTSNHLASFGAKVQYRIGKKENIKPVEYRLGLGSGYGYSFRTNPWRETGSKNVVAGMPVLKPDNFYLNLNISVLFNLSDF